MAQIVIASGLGDGRVAFLQVPVEALAAAVGADDAPSAEAIRWAPLIDEATVVEDDDAAAVLLSIGEADARARHVVVDPYLIEIEIEDGRRRPTKYREVIRCLGPTIRPDLGKQAEGASA